MAVNLIVSDIDGTLLTSDLQVSPKTRTAIRRVVDKGIPFVPVSARMPEAIHPIMGQIGIEMPIISYNGALVQDAAGREIFSRTMPGELAAEVCQSFEAEAPEGRWNIYSHHDWLSQARGGYWIEREERIVGLTSQRTSLSEAAQLPEAHKVLLMGDATVIAPLEAQLQARYPELSIMCSSPSFIEITAQGVHKGQAVELLAAHLAVPLAEVLAFGDNFNDLDMLQLVGHGVAMGNAPQAVKDLADRVTANHNQDGIAQVLEDLY